MVAAMPYVLLLDPSARWCHEVGASIVVQDPGWTCRCATGFLSALRTMAGAGTPPHALLIDADLASDAMCWLQRRLAQERAPVPLLVAITENLTLLSALHHRSSTIALAMPTTPAGMHRLARTVLRVLRGDTSGGTSAFSRRVVMNWHAQRAQQ